MRQPECYNDKCIEIYLTLINLRNFCDEKGENKVKDKYCEKLLSEFKSCEEKWTKCKETRYILS